LHCSDGFGCHFGFSLHLPLPRSGFATSSAHGESDSSGSFIERRHVFAGTLTDGNMGQSINAIGVPYEDNHIIGGAYDHDFFNYSPMFIVSGQVGLADRFGTANSGELWGGAHFRGNLPIGDVLYVTPGITLGLSAVTDCMGIECQRQTQHQGNAHLLFYFSPEVAVTFRQLPNIDLVYQLHHRSGLFGTLGKMEEGTNANVLGVRYHF
jgi:hypothetical protein